MSSTEWEGTSTHDNSLPTVVLFSTKGLSTKNPLLTAPSPHVIPIESKSILDHYNNAFTGQYYRNTMCNSRFMITVAQSLLGFNPSKYDELHKLHLQSHLSQYDTSSTSSSPSSSNTRDQTRNQSFFYRHFGGGGGSNQSSSTPSSSTPGSAAGGGSSSTTTPSTTSSRRSVFSRLCPPFSARRADEDGENDIFTDTPSRASRSTSITHFSTVSQLQNFQREHNMTALTQAVLTNPIAPPMMTPSFSYNSTLHHHPLRNGGILSLSTPGQTNTISSSQFQSNYHHTTPLSLSSSSSSLPLNASSTNDTTTTTTTLSCGEACNTNMTPNDDSTFDLFTSPMYQLKNQPAFLATSGFLISSTHNPLTAYAPYLTTQHERRLAILYAFHQKRNPALPLLEPYFSHIFSKCPSYIEKSDGKNPISPKIMAPRILKSHSSYQDRHLSFLQRKLRIVNSLTQYCSFDENIIQEYQALLDDTIQRVMIDQSTNDDAIKDKSTSNHDDDQGMHDNNIDISSSSSSSSSCDHASSRPHVCKSDNLHSVNHWHHPYCSPKEDRIDYNKIIPIELDMNKLPTMEQIDRVYHKESVLGCQHYERSVHISAKCCGLFYPCRYCHDLAQDHAIIRKDISRVVCMYCLLDLIEGECSLSQSLSSIGITTESIFANDKDGLVSLGYQLQQEYPSEVNIMSCVLSKLTELIACAHNYHTFTTSPKLFKNHLARNNTAGNNNGGNNNHGLLSKLPLSTSNYRRTSTVPQHSTQQPSSTSSASTKLKYGRGGRSNDHNDHGSDKMLSSSASSNGSPLLRRGHADCNGNQSKSTTHQSSSTFRSKVLAPSQLQRQRQLGQQQALQNGFRNNTTSRHLLMDKEMSIRGKLSPKVIESDVSLEQDNLYEIDLDSIHTTYHYTKSNNNGKQSSHQMNNNHHDKDDPNFHENEYKKLLQAHNQSPSKSSLARLTAITDLNSPLSASSSPIDGSSSTTGGHNQRNGASCGVGRYNNDRVMTRNMREARSLEQYYNDLAESQDTITLSLKMIRDCLSYISILPGATDSSSFYTELQNHNLVAKTSTATAAAASPVSPSMGGSNESLNRDSSSDGNNASSGDHSNNSLTNNNGSSTLPPPPPPPPKSEKLSWDFSNSGYSLEMLEHIASFFVQRMTYYLMLSQMTIRPLLELVDNIANYLNLLFHHSHSADHTCYSHPSPTDTPQSYLPPFSTSYTSSPSGNNHKNDKSMSSGQHDISPSSYSNHIMSWLQGEHKILNDLRDFLNYIDLHIQEYIILIAGKCDYKQNPIDDHKLLSLLRAMVVDDDNDNTRQPSLPSLLHTMSATSRLADGNEESVAIASECTSVLADDDNPNFITSVKPKSLPRPIRVVSTPVSGQYNQNYSNGTSSSSSSSVLDSSNATTTTTTSSSMPSSTVLLMDDMNHPQITFGDGGNNNDSSHPLFPSSSSAYNNLTQSQRLALASLHDEAEVTMSDTLAQNLAPELSCNEEIIYLKELVEKVPYIRKLLPSSSILTISRDDLVEFDLLFLRTQHRYILDLTQHPNQSCVTCTRVFSRVYCDSCRLYDDKRGKQVTHCPQCKICRSGAPNLLVHCNTCGVCYNSKTLKDWFCQGRSGNVYERESIIQRRIGRICASIGQCFENESDMNEVMNYPPERRELVLKKQYELVRKNLQYWPPSLVNMTELDKYAPIIVQDSKVNGSVKPSMKKKRSKSSSSDAKRSINRKKSNQNKVLIKNNRALLSVGNSAGITPHHKALGYHRNHSSRRKMKQSQDITTDPDDLFDDDDDNDDEDDHKYNNDRKSSTGKNRRNNKSTSLPSSSTTTTSSSVSGVVLLTLPQSTVTPTSRLDSNDMLSSEYLDTLSTASRDNAGLQPTLFLDSIEHPLQNNNNNHHHDHGRMDDSGSEYHQRRYTNRSDTYTMNDEDDDDDDEDKDSEDTHDNTRTNNLNPTRFVNRFNTATSYHIFSDTDTDDSDSDDDESHSDYDDNDDDNDDDDDLFATDDDSDDDTDHIDQELFNTLFPDNISDDGDHQDNTSTSARGIIGSRIVTKHPLQSPAYHNQSSEDNNNNNNNNTSKATPLSSSSIHLCNDTLSSTESTLIPPKVLYDESLLTVDPSKIRVGLNGKPHVLPANLSSEITKQFVEIDDGLCYPHICIPDIMMNPCMICYDDLSFSNATISTLSCGHLMHSHPCYQSAIKAGVQKCPLCKRSLVKSDAYDEQVTRFLELNPMPPEYNSVYCKIQCNDCLKSSEVKFHNNFMRCPNCTSYNTSFQDYTTPLPSFLMS